jgi:hypothetical protein
MQVTLSCFLLYKIPGPISISVLQFSPHLIHSSEAKALHTSAYRNENRYIPKCQSYYACNILTLIQKIYGLHDLYRHLLHSVDDKLMQRRSSKQNSIPLRQMLPSIWISLDSANWLCVQTFFPNTLYSLQMPVRLGTPQSALTLINNRIANWCFIIYCRNVLIRC